MNWLDRAIGAVAPGAALRRARLRQAIGHLTRAYEGARVGRRTDGCENGGEKVGHGSGGMSPLRAA
jgi:hypothetical protein